LIVLDTTVLVYAVGADHAYRDPCRRLIEAVDAGAVRASTTSGVIQEFAHVRARRRPRADARRLATDFADLLTPLVAVTEASLRSGLGLWGRHRRLGAFDAVLAAAATEAGATALVSSDRAFGALTELRHVLPDDDGVGSLLG